ncbi:hypothetical protein M5E89_00090 [Acidaminococcus intestini]|nr:hypothetical protein M5E89_00090 [Acidaminococcus intestini]
MIEETAQYCPHCGKAVIKSKAEVTPEKKKKTFPWRKKGKKSISAGKGT